MIARITESESLFRKGGAFLLAGALAVGCKSSSVSPTPLEAGPAAETSVPSMPSEVLTDAMPRSLALAPTKLGPVPIEGGERHALATSANVEVWSVPSGEGSDLVARRTDGKTPSRILRHTSGDVGEIRVDEDDRHLWVAWASTSARAEFVAVLYTDRTLSSVSVPATLVLKGGGGLYNTSPGSSLAIRATKTGAVVAHPAGRTTCKFGPGTESCPQFSVTALDEQLSQRVLMTEPVNGGPDITVDGFVVFDSGVAVSAFAWHGGPMANSSFIPWSGGPVRTLPKCRPPMQMQKVGEKLVIMCNDYRRETEKCPVQENDFCGRIVAFDPMSAAPPFRLLTKEPIEAQAKRF